MKKAGSLLKYFIILLGVQILFREFDFFNLGYKDIDYLGALIGSIFITFVLTNKSSENIIKNGYLRKALFFLGSFLMIINMQIISKDYQFFGITNKEIDYIGALVGAAVITYLSRNINANKKKIETKTP